MLLLPSVSLLWCLYMYVYVCVFLCVYLCMHTCVYMCVCVHTHTSSDYSVGVLVKGSYWCLSVSWCVFCMVSNFYHQKFPISSICIGIFRSSKNFMHMFRTVFSNHKGTLNFASRFERWFLQVKINIIIFQKKSMFGFTILVFVTDFFKIQRNCELFKNTDAWKFKFLWATD